VSHWITIHHSLVVRNSSSFMIILISYALKSKGNIATLAGVGVLVVFILSVNAVIVSFHHVWYEMKLTRWDLDILHVQGSEGSPPRGGNCDV